MPTLSIVLPFYSNPIMLARQYAEWSTYPAVLRPYVEAVIVDDASPDGAAVDVPFHEIVPFPLRIYRVMEDIAWHQHGARNLGAQEAAGDWLYLGDMDHLIPAETMAAMVRLCNYEAIYTFGRVDAPDLGPTMKNGLAHPHMNTFLMPRSAFWRIGGYDEDLTGYGTDGFFRARLKSAGVPITHRDDIRIVRYPREVIPDASTRTLPRKEGRPAGHKAQMKALADRKTRAGQPPTVIDFAWERVL